MRKKLGRSTNLVQTSEPPAPDGIPVFSATFLSDNAEKSRVLDELLDAIEKSGALKTDDMGSMRLALDEALVNAVMHGNRHDTQKKVRVFAWLSSARLSIVISDDGAGFKEEDLPDPQAPENLLEESGRGVILIRGIMDEVSYWNGGATLLMTKKRGQGPGVRGQDAK